MSQGLILKLLQELGRATTKQVSELAKERYPDSSLYLYAGDRLNKLHKWQLVDKDKNGFWFVKEGSA
jgi:nicotinic acid mononucleotide adenylyltransferase